MKIIKSILMAGIYLITAIFISISLAGCSGGATGLISITPEQYLASAKEQFETMDERDYEIRDLDEIIRILENAEKNAKKSETIDKSRMYLTLLHTMKARKQYQNALMKGEYVANRPEPFYTINTKEIKETLRTAKKWLRLTNSTFKTKAVLADLNYIKGIYYTQKMLTQQSRERQESLDEAITSFRRCLGIAPAYKGEFKLFGMPQTDREVKLKLIECLSLGGMAADAYGILSEFNFAPIIPISGANEKYDYQWVHMKALVLASMGMYEKAAETLNRFKVVSPVDYPMVDESIWLLEGIYKKLYETTKKDNYDMEAKIAAAMLKKLGGPFSNETYSDASLTFPRQLPGDLEYNKAVIEFYNGNFKKALSILNVINGKSVMSNTNRVSAKLLRIEALLYSGEQLTDDCIEDLISLSDNKYLNILQKNKLGYLIARYVMDEDSEFNTSRVNHEGQSFVRNFLGKPWTLDLKYKKGKVKVIRKPKKRGNKEEKPEEDEIEREPGEFVAEIYANKAEDWVVSANMYLVALPEMNILTSTRIVGREEDNKWHFKDEQLDVIKNKKHYLVIFEFDNSDSEKSIQGYLYE
jgi:ribosomal protein L22